MRSILADTDAAEDATQEAFIAAHRRLEELREPDKLAAWLGAIARNVARNYLRQHKLEQERFSRDREVVEALATTIGAPDQEFSYENVRTAVRSLAPPDRYTWKAIAISRVIKGHLTKLSVVNFPVELGQEYEVQIAARGASFTSYIDGKLVNQVTDENIRSGAIALIVWEGKVAFRDFRFRHLQTDFHLGYNELQKSV